MKKLLTFTSLFLFSLCLKAQDIVVLVPGFFNSFAPEYFSKDIVNTFRDKGFKVYIVGELDPLGTIEANGARLIPQLEAIQRDAPNSKLNLVAHSAGGFYALYAINYSKIRVDNLVTVSTPYEGVDFLEAWRDYSRLFTRLTDLAFLSGLRQLTKQYVDVFLKTIRVPENMKVFAFGGFQQRSLNIVDSRNLSGVMQITDFFIQGASDGIVSFKSSIASKTILDVNNKAIQMYIDRKFYVPLEHWEQVLDYQHFVLLGTPNVLTIRQSQIQFFGGLANLIAAKTAP